MSNLLAIGPDRAWTADLTRRAEAAGHRMTVRKSIFEAWALAEALETFAAVILDAEGWDLRGNPALHAFRARMRARFIVVHPASKATAPRMLADVLVPKASGVDAVLEHCKSWRLEIDHA